MRILRIIAPCLIAAGLVVGCDANTPTEQPTDVIGSPAFAADQNWIRDAFYQDTWIYVDCLGEDVNFYGWVPYQWHRVTSGSGGWNYHLQIRPLTPDSPPFLAVTESGIVYEYKNGAPINESFHSGPNVSYTLVNREKYVAENGDRLHSKANWHVTINANGDLTVDKFTLVATCMDK